MVKKMFWIEIILPILLIMVALYVYVIDLIAEPDEAIGEFTERVIFERASNMKDRSQIRTRLSEMGQSRNDSYGEFRYRQIIITGICALIPFFLEALMILGPLQSIGLSMLFGTCAFYSIDRDLTNKVNRKRQRIEAEFPAIIEMLTLAIAAGDTPVNAFYRVSKSSNSYLAKEMGKVVREVRIGIPFQRALDEMGKRLKSPAIRRFVDALIIAIVRGAPIVEVLHSHVAEARINHRNLIMDKAGKAETTMMIPIVFLILPISVLFALWPSVNQLSFFAG